MASALWNLAYDAGYGLGAVAFGVLAARAGSPIAFAVTSLLIATALAAAVPTGKRASNAAAIGPSCAARK